MVRKKLMMLLAYYSVKLEKKLEKFAWMMMDVAGNESLTVSLSRRIDNI